MRKPRDFDTELKALADKAKALKERRVRQLGELVAATGADALDADLLAGVLLGAVANNDATVKEGWRKAGTAFFRSKQRKSAPRSDQQPEGALPLEGGAASR
ncbi:MULTISPECIES: conjugal transfer protein TraD [Sphingomonas]|uniref:conjugal transfer protein TraD n=1 Tax=Sphingomonas TaxID=13687 RepID=UPI000DB09838|nr:MULTISPECIES: conjugal transfer protein TraD [Sphingomonas]MCP4028767.1 conjugal transfer protein TraD [Sphingomonas sp.]MDF0490183.1 conjugal transfer protein TraD [Sphingomonas pollutisoli]PZU08242.1 MAG: conjugal transfer protein TraD [Sphingomonas sp.]